MFCVFVGCLPGITRPGYFSPCGPAAHLKRGRGDVPRLAVPPAHDYRSLNSGNNLLSTLSSTISSSMSNIMSSSMSNIMSIVSYNVLHCYAPSF